MRRARAVSIPGAAAVTFIAVYQLAPVGWVGPQAAQPVTAATAAAPVGDAIYYPSCNAARAAGAAPIYRGQPGYREEMDGDGDGIACEPYRGLR